MPKINTGLQQAAEALIAQKIKRGELMTPRQNFANMELLTRMMTVAVNRGLGIGKKRFERDVQPVLDQLLEDHFKRVDNGGEDYAVDYIDRLYAEIMD